MKAGPLLSSFRARTPRPTAMTAGEPHPCLAQAEPVPEPSGEGPSGRPARQGTRGRPAPVSRRADGGSAQIRWQICRPSACRPAARGVRPSAPLPPSEERNPRARRTNGDCRPTRGARCGPGRELPAAAPAGRRLPAARRSRPARPGGADYRRQRAAPPVAMATPLPAAAGASARAGRGGAALPHRRRGRWHRRARPGRSGSAPAERREGREGGREGDGRARAVGSRGTGARGQGGERRTKVRGGEPNGLDVRGERSSAMSCRVLGRGGDAGAEEGRWMGVKQM